MFLYSLQRDWLSAIRTYTHTQNGAAQLCFWPVGLVLRSSSWSPIGYIHTVSVWD